MKRKFFFVVEWDAVRRMGEGENEEKKFPYCFVVWFLVFSQNKKKNEKNRVSNLSVSFGSRTQHNPTSVLEECQPWSLIQTPAR